MYNVKDYPILYKHIGLYVKGWHFTHMDNIHDCIMWLRQKVCTQNKIAFTPLLLIEVIMPKNESDRSGICVLEALILPL
jgi:hypothetical protein